MPVAQEARPRLLLVAAPNSYRTLAYLEAAQRRDVDVLVASEGEHALVGAMAGGLHVNLDDPGARDRLLEASTRQPFSGVIATDDSTVELASRVAAALGLPHNDPHAARLTRRKDLARAALQAAGVPVPAFRVIDIEAGAEPPPGIPFPCVVKPLSLSASRGVIRADDPAALRHACRRSAAIVAAAQLADEYAHTHLLVEAFVSGPEVAVEGLLCGGELRVLAIFDKPDPLEGPFFEETYYITPSRHAAAQQAQVIDTVAAACRGLGLREGPVHAEVRLSAAGCVVIELASRTIGGECARLLSLGTGHGLEDLVIRHALGASPDIVPADEAAGVLMIPIPQAGVLRRIEGLRQARAVPGIEEILVSIRDGYELVPLPEGGSYLGFMFARGPDAERVESALRTAHAALRIVTGPLMRIEDRRPG